MSTEQISLLLALLSFVAAGIGIVTLGFFLTGRSRRLRPYAELLLPLAFAIALVSTLGSLYYSGIVHFRPCRLCWWQRIFMYPLVPLLGLGWLRRDRGAAIYAIPLALGGLAYGAYHTQLRWFPEQGSSCEAEAACTSVWVNTFGFVSIPFMAFCGFLAVLGLATNHVWLTRAEPTEPNDLNPATPTPERQPV